MRPYKNFNRNRKYDSQQKKLPFSKSRILGRTGSFFLQAAKDFGSSKSFKVRVRTIFISLEEGYLNLTESKVTCDAIKDS